MTLELDEDEIRILQVALYEYVGQRGPNAEEYVDRRPGV